MSKFIKYIGLKERANSFGAFAPNSVTEVPDHIAESLLTNPLFIVAPAELAKASTEGLDDLKHRVDILLQDNEAKDEAIVELTASLEASIIEINELKGLLNDVPPVDDEAPTDDAAPADDAEKLQE